MIGRGSWKAALYLEPKQNRNTNRKINKAALKQAIKDRPDAFLREYAEQFNCTPSAVYYAFENLNITRKKTFTYYEKSQEKRAEYIAKLKRVPLNKRVYIDESGINTYMQRKYAHSVRGEIVEDIKRTQNFNRVNVIGALHNNKHFAVECYHQTTNSEFFETWFKNTLLNEIPQAHTVIPDNARFHRKKILKKPARGKAGLLFLPPYSPDYNRIEKSWANMKRFLCNNLQDFNLVDSTVYFYFYHAGC
jgi:transposase